MNLESDKRLNIQLRLDFPSALTGEARQAGWEDIESLSAVHEPERPANTYCIMEEVCERENLKEALRQVRSNKGSAGVDGMTVDKLGGRKSSSRDRPSPLPAATGSPCIATGPAPRGRCASSAACPGAAPARGSPAPQHARTPRRLPRCAPVCARPSPSRRPSFVAWRIVAD